MLAVDCAVTFQRLYCLLATEVSSRYVHILRVAAHSDPGLPFRIGELPGCLRLAGQGLRVRSLRISLRRRGLAWFRPAAPVTRPLGPDRGVR
jgi:hypothetical protein